MKDADRRTLSVTLNKTQGSEEGDCRSLKLPLLVGMFPAGPSQSQYVKEIFCLDLESSGRKETADPTPKLCLVYNDEFKVPIMRKYIDNSAQIVKISPNFGMGVKGSGSHHTRVG